MKICRSILGLLLGMLVACAPAWAQETPTPPEPDRPRIGIALSGGGARGIAHVGVLQTLHEMRVPIDYVSGSSIGAVVGAMFAIGLDPEEIERQILAIDWADLFSDNPLRENRTYRRKQDDRAYFLPLEFGLKGSRIVMAPGIIAGQKLNFALNEPELYLAGYDDFDLLPYPFRAVATDLHTGDFVTIDRGSLLQAVRASMSIPGVFPPVHWEGKLLVDSGVSNNMPVDVLRDMGADLVIAVDVLALPENTPDSKLKSWPGVIEQLAAILARQNSLTNIEDADVHLFVELGDILLTDFHRVGETIPLGQKAAFDIIDQLAPYALDEQAYAEHLERHRRLMTAFPVVDRIRLTNQSLVDDRAISKNIHQPVGEPLDLDLLGKNIGWVYDFGVFDLVEFQVTQEADTTTLDIITRQKDYAPTILNFGLNYRGGGGSDNLIEVRTRLTLLELNRYGGEWRNGLRIGQTSELNSEWYQPLGWHRRPFVALRGVLGQSTSKWYTDTGVIGDYLIRELEGQLHAGYRIGPIGEVRAGMAYGWVQATDKSDLGLDETDGPRGAWVAELGLDMFDAVVLPTRGYRAKGSLFLSREYLGSEADYDKLELGAATVKSWGSHSVSISSEGGTNLGTDLPDYETFTLGGLSQLSGYQVDEIRGQVYGVGALTWYKSFTGIASLISPAWYLGVQFEAGNAWDRAAQMRIDDLRYTVTLALMAKTLIGPTSVGYSRTFDGHDTFHLSLGGLMTRLD
jgi:NTE family protein